MMIRMMMALFCLAACACKKDTVAPAPQNPICGSAGWPQGNWKVKCVLSGLSSPDSVTFDVNGGQTSSGTYYFRKFINPNLTLADSGDFCGDLNSDINVRIYSADTSKLFTCSIYTNGQLIVQKTGHTTSGSHCYPVGGQCQ